MIYIVYLECNISDWYSANTLGRCWPTDQPFNPTVGRLVTSPTYPVGQLVTTPTYPVGQLVTTPTYPVGRLVTTPSPLSADWSTLQPHCRPTGHRSNIPCWLTGHHSNPTVGHLVTTPTYPVGHPISPTVGRLVTLTGHHLHLPCRLPS